MNCKATTKRLGARIKINKPQVRMILRVKKILQAQLKRKKIYRMVMFVYINAVKYYELQPSNARE